MTDQELWDRAVRCSYNVEFLTTKEEIRMYANAVFLALKWGRDVK